MSEYQYYEFRAIDKPLTPAQMAELRALSSRAAITSRGFTNTYNYSGFRGDPNKLMETHFDAYVYASNFGTMTFALRLPGAVLSEEAVRPYESEFGVSSRTAGEYTILEWQLADEPSGEWIEGEGWMDRLLPIREEVVRGDYRSFYIGWLASIQDTVRMADQGDYAYGEYDDEEDQDEENDEEEDESREHSEHVEPPVPAGLDSLTDAQTALAEFLNVGKDLIAAAAEASPALSAKTASDKTVTEWVALMPEGEVRSIVARVVKGEGQRVQAELQSRYHRSGGGREESAAGASRVRTSIELLARAEQITVERKQREREEQERKRREHLAGIAQRFPELWATVYQLAGEQTASAYDKIRDLLVDMRDASRQVGGSDFDGEFARFLQQAGRSPALKRRFKESGLVA
jgi:hypothetical protein